MKIKSFFLTFNYLMTILVILIGCLSINESINNNDKNEKIENNVEIKEIIKYDVKILLMLDILSSLICLDDSIINLEEKIRSNDPFKADLSISLNSILKKRHQLRKMYYELNNIEAINEFESFIKEWNLEDKIKEICNKNTK